MKDTNLKIREEFQLPDGGYIGEVIDIVHDKELKCLHVYCDIANNLYNGDYRCFFDRAGFCVTGFTVRYDSEYIAEFVDFISVLPSSNEDFTFDINDLSEEINCIDISGERRPDWDIGLVIQKAPRTGFYHVTQITTVENIKKGRYQLSDMEQLEVTIEQFEDVINSVRKFLTPRASCFISIIQRELDKAIISFLAATKLAITERTATGMSYPVPPEEWTPQLVSSFKKQVNAETANITCNNFEGED